MNKFNPFHPFNDLLEDVAPTPYSRLDEFEFPQYGLPVVDHDEVKKKLVSLGVKPRSERGQELVAELDFRNKLFGAVVLYGLSDVNGTVGVMAGANRGKSMAILKNAGKRDTETVDMSWADFLKRWPKIKSECERVDQFIGDALNDRMGWADVKDAIAALESAIGAGLH